MVPDHFFKPQSWGINSRNRTPLNRRPGVAALFLITSLWMSGCALLKNTPAVELPTNLPATWSRDADIDTLPITSGLLDLIEAPQLTRLVEEALANNPNLGVTALRLQAAGYLLTGSRARMLPQVNAQYSVERHNQGIDAGSGKRKTVDVQRLGLNVSWEIDIWGRLADAAAASRQAYRAQGFEYQQARDALAARVIQAWIEQVAIRDAIRIEEERLAVLTHIENLLIDSYREGIGSLDELATASARAAVARADLSTQQGAWQSSIRRLEVLAGRYPRGDLLTSDGLPRMGHPALDLPVGSLLKRPDIQSAWALAQAAHHLSDAGKKARLPNLQLSADLFKSSVRLDNIGGTRANWNLVGALLQPIFDGGRLRSESQARQAEAQAALMELQDRILQALQEVEEALIHERELAVQAEALDQAVSASAQSSQYYDQRYRQGLDSLQSLLIAKEQEISLKLRLNDTTAQRLLNRVDLSLALGMGLDKASASSLKVSQHASQN